jgi:hypothetical protein
MQADQDEPALDWARYKDEILDLYVSQDKTLSEVMRHMNSKYNIKARYLILRYLPLRNVPFRCWHIILTSSYSERQYKYRLKNLKNVSINEWACIHDECSRREALDKSTVVCLHGRPLPPERVTRGIARARKIVSESRIDERRFSACE